MAMKEAENLIWYRNGMRARLKGNNISRRSAETVFIVYDEKIRMFGIGIGSKQPDWCVADDGYKFITLIEPLAC